MLQTDKGHPDQDSVAPYRALGRGKPFADAVLLMETFGFRAISQPLKYSREERQKWADTVYRSCADLAALWGIPERAIGGYGRLALGMPIAGSPSALAAYHDRARAITVAASSTDFARAWILAWDHMLGDMARQPSPGRTPFPRDPEASPLLSASLPLYCRSGYRGHERFHILTPALLRERLQQAPKSPHQPGWVEDWMRTVVALRWKSTAGQIRPTEYFVASQKAEGRKIQPYWSAPQEMMARALSFWIAHQADQNGVRNPWLAQPVLSLPRPLAPAAQSAIERGLKSLVPVLDQQGATLVHDMRKWAALMESVQMPQAVPEDFLEDPSDMATEEEGSHPH